MSNLLLSINTKEYRCGFEKQLLPSCNGWRRKRPRMKSMPDYRRLFTDILSANTKRRVMPKKYFVSGAADWVNKEYVKDGWGYFRAWRINHPALSNEGPAGGTIDTAGGIKKAE